MGGGCGCLTETHARGEREPQQRHPGEDEKGYPFAGLANDSLLHRRSSSRVSPAANQWEVANRYRTPFGFQGIDFPGRISLAQPQPDRTSAERAGAVNGDGLRGHSPMPLTAGQRPTSHRDFTNSRLAGACHQYTT